MAAPAPSPSGPLVSVVIPAYNYGSFLADAVASVQLQTLADWECLIVDDGSTDDTESVARTLVTADRRVQYQYQPNRGLSAARNAGLARARGRYVQFLDADDLIEPAKLTIQVELMDREKSVDVSYTGYQRFNSETGARTGRYADLELSSDPLQDFLYRWQRGLSIPILCSLFRRELWPDGLAFEERLRSKEDWIMWIDLARRGARFHFIDRDLALYRAHRRAMTTDRLQMLLDTARAAEVIIERLDERQRAHFVDQTSEYLAGTIRQRLQDVAAAAPHGPITTAAGAEPATSKSLTQPGLRHFLTPARNRLLRLFVGRIAKNPLFDSSWYLSQYSDVARSGADPYHQFRSRSAAEGRNPNEFFETEWYLDQYEDVRASGVNPLDHYFRYGASEGKDPGPKFDTDWYLNANPDVSASGMNPLLHYLRHGRAEGRLPAPQARDR